jgi:regulatory protein
MAERTITALRAQERDSQRVNVFIDGAFAIGVSLTTLTREGLFVGKQLDEAAWARLEASESSDKALHAALRYLELRPRSAAEVRERLRQKGYAPEPIAAAVERLIANGLIDDESFSRFWVESRQRSRPKGQLALRAELRQKGVDRDTIEATLNEHADPDGEHAQAEALARQNLHKYAAAADRQSFQRRMGGFLMRRGFTPNVVMPILSTLWREVQSREEDAES